MSGNVYDAFISYYAIIIIFPTRLQTSLFFGRDDILFIFVPPVPTVITDM